MTKKPFRWLYFLTIILLSAVYISLAHASASFTPDKMGAILYGAAYYPEYMPYERVEKDIALMRQAGLNVVRMGESSWGLWEPQDGKFDFAWMDRVIEQMHKAGIHVIMGTPTYSVPAWMYKEHPEIFIVHNNGQTVTYGLRQDTDLMNPVYRKYCERIIRQLMEHYKDNPAIIGWQIDNETSAGHAANSDVQSGFVTYLQRKYKTVDELNKDWLLNYWGQRLNDWSEVPPAGGILNPGWKLEWQRYQQWITTDFLTWQTGIVNQYKRPEQFITHDLAGPPRPEVDEYAIARAVDIVAVNPYHGTQDHFDGGGSSMQGDYVRSLKHTNYLVTETNAQAIGWDSKGQFPPYDGQLRLDVYTHIATGANMVEYWHWHSIHNGQEMYWKGVLSHDLEPNRAYAEVTRTARELESIGSELVDLTRTNRVAILYSADSYYGIEFMKFSDTVNYRTILGQMYDALYRANVGVDFVFPESANLSEYKLIVVPPLYVANDALLEQLVAYVRGGGHVVMAMKSGFTNEFDSVRATMAPGPLRQAAGFRYQEFSTLEKPLSLKGDPFKVGGDNHVSDWAEMLVPEGAEALAYYDHPFFGKYPAIMRNHFEKGTLTYEGTVLSDSLQEALLLQEIELAGLANSDQQLPKRVRIKHCTNRKGKLLHFYLNYSGDEQTVPYKYKDGQDLLSKAPVAAGQTIELKPWDLAIVEER
jgi:beta-galactosidase